MFVSSLCHLTEAIAMATDISANQQLLLYHHQPFSTLATSATIDTMPRTTEDDPIYLIHMAGSDGKTEQLHIREYRGNVRPKSCFMYDTHTDVP